METPTLSTAKLVEAEDQDAAVGEVQPLVALESTVWPGGGAQLIEMLENLQQNPDDLGASSSTMSRARDSKLFQSDCSEVSINVRSWSLEPFDASQLDLAGSLFEAILNSCNMITRRAARTKYARRLYGELERLFLWGDGFSASQGHLDEILAKSAELHQAVLSCLYEVGKIVKDDLFEAVNQSSVPPTENDPSETTLIGLGMEEAVSELRLLLEKAATILDASEATTDFESLSGDGLTIYDLDDILDDLATYIDCLMDLSLALESPVVDLDASDQDQENRVTSMISQERLKRKK
jgi:hypothetical protein